MERIIGCGMKLILLLYAFTMIMITYIVISIQYIVIVKIIPMYIYGFDLGFCSLCVIVLMDLLILYLYFLLIKVHYKLHRKVKYDFS